LKGIVIAAGEGQRLSGLGPSKPLVPLSGKPILEHIVERSREGGLDEVIVVVGHRAELIEGLVTDLNGCCGVEVVCVHNSDWRRGNGTSVLAAARRLDEPFVLMMADHLVDPSIIGDLSAVPLAHDEIVLAIDRRLDNPLVDFDDVTRVETGRGKIVRIGKTLTSFDAFDTGLFLCAPRFRDTLERAAAAQDKFELSAGVQAAAKAGRAAVFDIGERFWIDIDNEEMLYRAEAALRNSGGA